MPAPRVINFEPSLTLCLDESCQLQCRLAIETRTNATQVRTREYRRRPDQRLLHGPPVLGQRPRPVVPGVVPAASARSARRSSSRSVIPRDRPAAGSGHRLAVDCTVPQSEAPPVQTAQTRPSMPRLSYAGQNLTAETAFTVLAVARQPEGRGQGRRRAGDRRQPVSRARRTPRRRASGRSRRTRPATARAWACPTSARRRPRSSTPSSAIRPSAENIVVASGAKPFEQFFAEALLDPGDGVLVFSPHFPTYVPNLERRGARAVLAPLQGRERVPARAVEDVEQFLADRPPAARDLPQLAAQPDRRRGHPRRPGRDRRPGARAPT